jgi:hypothetical protein
MARSLTVKLQDKGFSLEIEKIDRRKIYGWVDKKAYDRDGNECMLGTLSGDGTQIFGKDCFEQGYLNNSGRWVEKSDLSAAIGDQVFKDKEPSSFNSEIDLNETISIDDFLLHTVKNVYLMNGENAETLKAQITALDGIPTFKFNYVASYQPDTAFLVINDGDLFMITAEKTDCQFIGFEDQNHLISDDELEEEDESDDFDFGMM